MSDEKIDLLLMKTTRIETALWPDEGQPSVLTQHNERIAKLEGWRNWLAGAWAALSLFLGIHISRHGG